MNFVFFACLVVTNGRSESVYGKIILTGGWLCQEWLDSWKSFRPRIFSRVHLPVSPGRGVGEREFLATKARQRNYHKKSEDLTEMSAADQPPTDPTVLLYLYLLSMVATVRFAGLRCGCDGRLGLRRWRDRRLPDRTCDGQDWLRRDKNGSKAVRL